MPYIHIGKPQYHVEAAYWDLAKKGMAAARKKFNLPAYTDPTALVEDNDNNDDDEEEEAKAGGGSIETNNIDATLGANTNRRGATHRPHTKKSYNTTLRGLRWWCCLVGDYESLLVVQQVVPVHCPSMNPRTLELFARYKNLIPEKPLTFTNADGETKEFLDVLKNRIIGRSRYTSKKFAQIPAWNAPQAHKTFCSAVKSIHESIKQLGPYRDKCEECLKKPLDQRHIGCVHRSRDPYLFAEGILQHRWRCHSLAASLNDRQSRGVKSLYDLAKNFVEGVCEVNPSANTFSLLNCLQKVMDYQSREIGIGQVIIEY